MKPSQFNVFVELDGGQKAVYNTATAGVLPLPDALWRLLQEKTGRLPRALVQPPQLREALLLHKVLVPHDVDEIQHPIHQRFRTFFASPTATFVVLPSNECNLACHYCAAEATKKPDLPLMSAELADRVVTFLGHLMHQNRCRLGTIGFYGGEPLLNPEACARIMTGMLRFGQERNVAIRFVVTTNGVLLEKLGDSPILDMTETFHVTLDGNREYHNRIRKTRGGKPTYDRIMAGLAVVIARDAGLVVRIHSNHLTGERFREVLDDLEHAGLRPDSKSAVIIGTYGDISSIMDDPDLCNRVVLGSRRAEREHRAELFDSASSHRLAPLFRGVHVDQDRRVAKPLNLAVSCDYAKAASATINAVGEVFYCPDIPGLARPVGRIDDSGNALWERRYFEQLTRRWWPDGTCAHCEYLPVCGGGCPLEPRDTLDDCADLRRDFKRRIIEYAASVIDERA